MEPEEDYSLIEKAKEDPEAFGNLYDRYLPLVYRYVVRRVGNKEIAEDITSQTFEKALRSLDSLREGMSFRMWLYRIAGNNIVDYYRSKGRQRILDLAEAQNLADKESEKAAERVENRVAIQALLDRLPEPQKAAMVLHFLEGFTIEEVAEAMGSSPTACYMRIYRATKAISGFLDQKDIRRVDDYVAHGA